MSFYIKVKIKMKIVLRRTPKRYFFDSHRALTPEETLSDVEDLKDKVGITKVEDLTGRDKLDIPIC
jgi:ribosomal protein S12 methylthiotransferase accessory factor